ncbi:MAG: amino acid adenylation domain-containing protein [Chloroflexaceae bacterium]|nr:amino acid adenylation domain-containing protein [Chloroflexaceae bacterium]
MISLNNYQCIQLHFQEQVNRTPEQIAVFCGDRSLSFGALNRQANQLAHFLAEQGVGAETLVGICVERSLDMVIGLLAILKAGAAYVPLDPSYPTERLAYMIQDAQVRWLLIQSHLTSQLPGQHQRLILLDQLPDRLAACSSDNPPCVVTPEQLAYVIYTSGSTGRPKGVMGLHQGSMNRFAWMWQTYPFEPWERCCQKTALSFVDSVWEIFGPLLQGIPLVILPDDVVRRPLALVDALSTWQITRLVLVPSLLAVLLEQVPDIAERLPRLRYWTSSGEALPLALLQRFQQQLPEAVLLNLYGSSEVSADATWYDSRDGAIGASVPIGRPIANMHAYVLDDANQHAPPGVIGELHLSGVGLARGYLNRPALTAERFVPNPFDAQGQSRLYKTGDLVRRRADGLLDYIGRKDHQVNIRGFRIEPGEIEQVLSEHPMVERALVTAWKEVLREPGGVIPPGVDPRLIAYVIPSPDHVEASFETQVQQWGAIFGHYYDHESPSDDPTFNFASWVSSYTGASITAAEMREWLDDTVEPIVARQPQHVLEIGCGTGMLIFRIALRHAPTGQPMSYHRHWIMCNNR